MAFLFFAAPFRCGPAQNRVQLALWLDLSKLRRRQYRLPSVARYFLREWEWFDRANVRPPLGCSCVPCSTKKKKNKQKTNKPFPCLTFPPNPCI
jgi:hypothetical protein